LKAALEGVLVELYSKIGDDVRALPLAEARRDLALKSAGPDSVEYGDALFALAKAQGGVGRHDMAEEAFRQATAVFQRHAQEREGQSLVSERMRAFQLIKLHREAEARELLLLTVPKLEAYFGSQSWEVAQGRDRLALAFALEGDHTRAAQMYDLLEPFMASPPAAHVLDAAVVREHQGVSLRLAGRLDAAENAISSAIATFDSRLGRYNPDSIAMQQQLAIVLTDAGRFAQAAQAFEGNVERAVRVFGMHDPQTAMRQSSRLPSLIMLGRIAEAEVIGRQAVADAESKPGLSAVEVLGVRRTLALALIFSGKPAEAADLLQQVVTQEQAAGDRSPRHATTLLYQAGARNALHQFDAAAQLARQSAALLEGDPDSSVLLAKVRLTEALARAQAEVNFKRRLNPDHPAFLFAALVQAELRRAGGDAVGAERVATDARTRLRSVAGVSLPEFLPLIF
jgi:eukaryotic-like serine/threonine-protein kinase